MKLQFTTILLILCLSANSQPRLIEGRVVSAVDNMPLPNASIRIVGNQGLTTQANAEGYFALHLESNRVSLLITHIGYQKQELDLDLPTAAPLVVALVPDPNELDEVVVSTGYEDIPVERATGSYELVGNTLFNRQISTDVISRLDGLVAGVLFDKRGGTSRSFRIRGISTLSSAAQPLIILDNFPYEGDIRNLNPNEVETVTFLKDAAAASIWGAKAGNGVLVIKSKKGTRSQPFNVEVSTNLTSMDKPNLFYEPQMSSSDFIDVEKFLFEQGAYNSRLNNSTSRPVITPVVEILQKERLGLISSSEADKMIEHYRAKDIRNDYRDYFYRRSVSQQHALAMSGGADKVAYRLSIGYDRNLHQLVENNDERLVIRFNNAYTPINNIELTTDVNYTLSNRQNNNPGIVRPGTTGTIYPYASLVDDSGQSAVVEQQYRLSYVDTAGNDQLLDWKYRPLDELYQANNITQTRHVMLNFGANYNIAPQLAFSVRYQYANQAVNNKNIQGEELFYTRDYINRFTDLIDGTVNRNVPLGAIYDYTEDKSTSHALRAQLILTELQINKHNFSAMIGVETRQVVTDMYTNRSYGYNVNLKTSQPVDLVNRFATYDRLTSDQQIENKQAFHESNDRFVSFYGNIAYTFDNRYTLSGSVRKDASNIFGTSTNNKWKPLWSMGMKWDVNHEAFFPFKDFDLLTVKASYGHSGNVNNSVPAISTIRYDSNLSALGRLPFAYIENPPNPHLRWENVSMGNFELAFSLWNRAFGGRVEYYHKKSTDLIGSVNMDMTTGYSLYTANSATTENRGFDVTLNNNNKLGKLNWNITALYSNNRSKLLKYDYKDDLLYTYVTTPGLRPPLEGFPLNSIFSYRWAGLDPADGAPLGFDQQGNRSRDYNLLTRPSSIDELVFNGTALPQSFGSLRNELEFKGISISANITYRFDYFFRRSTVNFSSLLNANPVVQHGDFEKRWRKPGDENITNVPALVYPSNSNRDMFFVNSEVNIEKGDHIRLQDINISYFLNHSLTENIGAESIKFTFYANNIGILWSKNKVGRDPDYIQAPPVRSLALGINVRF